VSGNFDYIGILMRAMILAAGLGKRMQSLTAEIPKPLLEVGDKSLIVHQVERLVAGGVTGIVINHFYLGEKIQDALGDGSQFGIEIVYSKEAIRLDTGGGIIKSLPKLKDDSFIVVNADVWTDFDFSMLRKLDSEEQLAHLVLVENSKHNPLGDFCINENGKVNEGSGQNDKRLTFSGISVLSKKLFEGFSIRPLSLVPLLQKAMRNALVSGEVHDGLWFDVGTPERLREVNALVTRNK
jgi:MurNAc alpha-1-phosphate uridylyltransferase